MKALRLPLLIIAAVIALDQLTKWWALVALTPLTPVPVLGDFFMLTLVFNEGGAMGTSFGSSGYYLTSSLLILAFIFVYLYLNRDNRSLTIPLSLIAGGAIGNILDRLRLGRVVDFIDIDFFDITIGGFSIDRWWTFNIADTAISCAVILLLFRVFFGHGHSRTHSTQPLDTAGRATSDSATN